MRALRYAVDAIIVLFLVLAGGTALWWWVTKVEPRRSLTMMNLTELTITVTDLEKRTAALEKSAVEQGTVVRALLERREAKR